MTTYYDHYFDTADVSAFLPLLASEVNIIGPLFDEATQRTYIAVRADHAVEVPAGCSITPLETGVALLGVWA